MKRTWALFVFLSGFFLVSCNNNKDVWYPVPDNSSVVIAVDPVSISQKIVWDKLGDFDLFDLFKSAEEDSAQKTNELSSILSNPGKAGIDLLEKFYFCRKDGIVAAFASLEDEDDFSYYLQETLKKNILSYQQYKFTHIDSLVVAWNKDHCVFLLKEDLSSVNQKELGAILDLKKENTVFADPDFIKAISEASDLTAWFNSSMLLKEQPVGLSLTEAFLTKSYSTAYLNFEEDKIELKVRDLFSKELSQLLKSDSSPDLILPMGASDYISLGAISIDIPKAMELIQGDSIEKKLQKVNLTKQGLSESLNGQFIISFSDFKEKKTIYRSYAYDENFNMVDITDTITTSYPAFSAFIGTTDQQKAKAILTALSSAGIISEKDGHYNSVFTQVSINLFHLKDGILISNESPMPLDTATKNASSIQQLTAHPLVVYLNATKLAQTIKSTNKPTFTHLSFIEKASTKVVLNEDKTLMLVTEIELKKTGKNSLLSLMDMLKQSNPSTL